MRGRAPHYEVPLCTCDHQSALLLTQELEQQTFTRVAACISGNWQTTYAYNIHIQVRVFVTSPSACFFAILSRFWKTLSLILVTIVKMGQYWKIVAPRKREYVAPRLRKLGEFLFEGTPACLVKYLARPISQYGGASNAEAAAQQEYVFSSSMNRHPMSFLFPIY